MRCFLLALAFSGSLGKEAACNDCSDLTWTQKAGLDPKCCIPYEEGYEESYEGGEWSYDTSSWTKSSTWWIGETYHDPGYEPWYYGEPGFSYVSYKIGGKVYYVCSDSSCTNPDADASAGGDPVTRFENRETRFWLATDVLTYVFKQLSYTIFYRAGPARATPKLSRRGDWVGEAEIRLGGAFPETIHIEMVDPDLLLNRETAFPVLGANLTTIRLSVGGKQLVVGNHPLSAGAVSVSAAPLGKSSRIGNGFVERVEIKGDGIHVRFTSAKAQKFSDEAKQVKALHLDCEFVKFNRTAARGPLPEMWGLQPLSTETMLLLVPPKIAAQVDGSIIEA